MLVTLLKINFYFDDYRKTLIQFLYSVRESNGAFRMHVGGEVDVRGAYCAISAAKLINLSKSEQDKLFKDTVQWIVSCQTYEGGLGGAPYLEAHGGYSFCGIAALTLLGSTGNCDLKALLVRNQTFVVIFILTNIKAIYFLYY